MNLAEQERREGIACFAAEVVARGIVTGRLQVIECELATLIGNGPAGKRELMAPVFKPDFDRVLALYPCQIIRELPAIVRQKTKVAPSILANRVIRNRALEIEQRRPGSVVQNSAMIRAAQQFRPAHTCRQRIAAHEPTVPRNRRVINKVVANDPVKLRVRMLRGDALVKAIPVICVVFLG